MLLLCAYVANQLVPFQRLLYLDFVVTDSFFYSAISNGRWPWACPVQSALFALDWKIGILVPIFVEVERKSYALDLLIG